MRKLGFQAGGWLKPDQSLVKFFVRQLIYSIAGAGLYFLLSWLSFTTRLPGFSNVTFRPASVILVLFGVLFGPWVGLLSGVIGKTLADVVAGWGFYWNGSIAYGLIGFVSGFVKIAFPELHPPRNILRAVLAGALGILFAAIFLSASASYLGDVDLASAFRAFFWPEFAGNLVVVIILLPLLIVAISAIQRKWKS
jgi:energy-coupling factor transport system substrate-specific component